MKVFLGDQGMVMSESGCSRLYKPSIAGPAWPNSSIWILNANEFSYSLFYSFESPCRRLEWSYVENHWTRNVTPWTKIKTRWQTLVLWCGMSLLSLSGIVLGYQMLLHVYVPCLGLVTLNWGMSCVHYLLLCVCPHRWQDRTGTEIWSGWSGGTEGETKKQNKAATLDWMAIVYYVLLCYLT